VGVSTAVGRIKLRDTLYSLLVLSLGIVLGGWTVVVYFALLFHIRDISSMFVNVTSTVLFLFLILLIVRYLLLLWASFNQHYESFVFDEKMEGKDFTASVSVLVPAYNEGPNIESAIQSLLEMDYPDLEIIVINDASSDDTFLRASRWAGYYRNAQVKVIDREVNRGKAEALNLGIQNSTRDIVVCMDADSRLEPQALLKGVAHFIDPKVAAVAGNVKVVNRKNLLTRLQSLEYILGLNLVRRAQGYYQCVNIIPGPMGFFRRSVLDEIGGYESDTFAEDCDLTVKMLARGMRVNYEPGAISWTEAPETIMGLITQRYRWTRGILQSLKKHKFSLFHMRDSGFINSSMLWYMMFEAIAWPAMNIFGNLFFLFVAFWYGAVNMLLLWWLILVLLDLIVSLHAVSLEEEDLSMVFYAVPYRMVFLFAVDVTKLLATFEELLKVKMTWGRIERMGRTKTSAEGEDTG